MAALLLLFSIVAAVSCIELDKVNLTIDEEGTDVKETIYADPKGRYEIIKVPAHNNRDALTVLKDFKLKLAILKVKFQFHFQSLKSFLQNIPFELDYNQISYPKSKCQVEK